MAAGLRLSLGRRSPTSLEEEEKPASPLPIEVRPLSDRVSLAVTPGLRTPCVTKRFPPGFTPERNKENGALKRLNGVSGVPGLHKSYRRLLVMESAPGASLEGKQLSEEQALSVLTQLQATLAEVHSRGVIHADVKPDNMIFSDSGKLFLIDWGSAVMGIEDRMSFDGGTPGYLPPAILLHASYGSEIDHFGVALTVYELLMGKPFFDPRYLSLRESVEQLVHQLGVPAQSLLDRALYAKAFFEEGKLREEMSPEIAALPKWSEGLSPAWVERLSPLLSQL